MSPLGSDGTALDELAAPALLPPPAGLVVAHSALARRGSGTSKVAVCLLVAGFVGPMTSSQVLTSDDCTGRSSIPSHILALCMSLLWRLPRASTGIHTHLGLSSWDILEFLNSDLDSHLGVFEPFLVHHRLRIRHWPNRLVWRCGFKSTLVRENPARIFTSFGRNPGQRKGIF